MTEIRPFRGWHYHGQVSNLIAPPYDILSAADKDALLRKSRDNIVSVDLPHVPPKDVGPDQEYQAAAEKLSQLQRTGILMQDAQPALYAYSQEYTWAGRKYLRLALICGVRATEFYDAIWPHEKTFAGPKADRLKLTEYTRIQLSPIFGIYDDAGVSDMLWSAPHRQALAVGELGGAVEEIWAVSDPALIARVQAALADRPIFIADGHHRYTTALNYRNALQAAGQIGPEHEANFVMFALIAMSDPGLLVLPTHRMIAGIGSGYACEDLMCETRNQCRWQRVAMTDALERDADAFLKPFGPHAMAFVDARLDAVHVAQLADASVMDRLAGDQPAPWRELDVAILHKYFLDQYVARHTQGQLQISYSPHGPEVMSTLRKGQCQMVALVQGTPLGAVREIALARAVMPHKSTYFYPKLATGMVLKPLE